MTWLEASLRWYGVLLAVTWGWAPLVRWLLPRLADRGASVARPLALLGVVTLAWLPASLRLVPYSAAILWAVIGVGAVAGWAVALRTGAIDRGWLRSLLIVEGCAALAFIALVWLHGYTPNLVATEKPMDIAFLSSGERTTTMPPPDPWFSGQPINYYYMGYVLFGSVGRLAGVPSSFAFNLAIATIFSMTLVGAGGVAFDAVRAQWSRNVALAAALLAAFGLVIAGNLYAPLQLAQTPSQTIHAWWWDKQVGIGWRSSRIVCDGPRVNNDCVSPSVETINEFPFFSLLLGDLHPHLMALPFVVASLALALALGLRGLARPPTLDGADLGRLAISGAAIGSLYALNSWDFPTYLLVALGAVVVGFGSCARCMAKAGAVVVAAAIVVWLPFILTFVPPTGGGAASPLTAMPILSRLAGTIGVWTGERTSIGEYLTIFGAPYVFALALIVSESQRPALARRLNGPVLLFPALVIGILAIGLSAPVLVLVGVPLVLAIDRLLVDHEPSPATFATGLFAIGFFLSGVVELFYIRDVFDDRMNTLFKVYYQVWTLFAFAMALTVVCLWQRIGGRVWRVALAGATALAIVAGSVYPALASWQWTNGFTDWQGVDGLGYLADQHPDELAALRWLRANARPNDVVLEAAGCSYQPNGELPFNRAAAYTGVPDVIGWDNHERQWRGGQPALIDQIPVRQRDVASMFSDPRSPLIDRYGVTLLYDGIYEHGNWQNVCGMAGPYPGMDARDYPGPGWDLAFQSGEVRVYRRATGG